MNREFTAGKVDKHSRKKSWYSAVEEANDMIIKPTGMDIQAYMI